jgi:WASH complex subunit strumpellin
MNKLHHMIQIMGIKKNVLSQMTEIVDFSYAWVAMDRYLVRLQETIGSNPKSVLMLKTVFIKMSTIMETPLRRIAQANSEDFESVARYYSGQLLKFIKSVLYVIPVNIFKELDLVSQIMSKDVKEFKVKINKDTLKEQTLFD